MSKITKFFLIVTLLAVIGLAFVYPRIKNQSNAPEPVSTAEKDSRLPVSVYRVTEGVLEDKILVNGTILADEEAVLRSEVAGTVREIHFREGTVVQKGTPLVKTDDAELQAERRRLEYELALARETESRQRNLLKKGTVSQEDYDRALNRVNTLRAQLEVVQARLHKTLVSAPFDGVIGFREVSAGAYITPNTAIARIQKIDPVKIAFAIPEKYAARVRPGNRISFNVAGLERRFEGRVYAVEPRIDTVTRTLPIRATSPNPHGELLPGGFASVELVFESIADALMIPTEALIPTLEGKKVFVLENGRAVSRVVRTGIRTARSVQVTDGLKAGDRVIRTGLLQIREGIEVRVLEGELLSGGSL